MRIKPIPPTMREKDRYLLIRNCTWREIERAVRRKFGEVYRSLSGLKRIEEGEDYVIVRVFNDFEWMIRAAIALESFERSPVWVELSSGTIRRLKRKAGISTIV